VINYFTYGPNNAKARQTGTDGSKVYLGGYEDWITAGQTKVSLGNYAQITNGTGGRVLHYFLTDRLGSVDAVTDGNGNLIETRGYDAFGAPRTGLWGDASQIASTAITPKGFTSHEHLNSVKLIHMNGRMYDFQLGRFLGVDPLIQAPTNSQSMNPYSYIMNNPLAGTDPTGYTTECVDAGCPDETIKGSDIDSIQIHKDGTVTATTTDGTTYKVSSITSANGSTVQLATGSSSSVGAPGLLGIASLALSNLGSAVLPQAAPSNLQLRKNYATITTAREYSTYSDNEKQALVRISNQAAAAKAELERRVNDKNLPAAVQESAARQLATWSLSNYQAFVLDDFSDLPNPKLHDDEMAVLGGENYSKKPPSVPLALFIVVNLKLVIQNFSSTQQGTTARLGNNSSVSYRTGEPGIFDHFMHETRHLDPYTHVRKNGAGWRYYGGTPASNDVKERDAHYWSTGDWGRLSKIGP